MKLNNLLALSISYNQIGNRQKVHGNGLLHSYYDSGTNKWYLSDITRKDDQLFVECLLCKQNIEIQTLDDNWKNNVLVKTSTTKLSSFLVISDKYHLFVPES